MAESSTSRWLLIVTGSSLRAEEVDRPLGYYLARQVEQMLLKKEQEEGFKVRVVSDLRWLHDDSFQEYPSISIGGPGVNLLTHRWLEELPLSMAVEDQYFVQMDPDLDELKASLWGMNNTSTQIAVSAFEGRFLSRFIDRCLEETPGDLEDLDDSE